MTKSVCRHISNFITAMSLCLLLVACDGGIFGTGDGGSGNLNTDGVFAVESVDTDGAETNGEDDVIPNQDIESETPDSDTIDAGAGADTDGSAGDAGGDPANAPVPTAPSIPVEESPAGSQDIGSFTDDFVPAEDTVVSVNGQLSFTNSVVIEDSSTEIAFVNDTNMTIRLFTSQDSGANSLPTLSFGNTAINFISPNSNVLFVDQITPDNERINQITIDPLSIENGSNSLLVLTNTAIGIQLLAVPSYNTRETDNLVPRRFIATELAGDPAVSSTLVLTPDPSFEGAGVLPTITFDPITSELPITNFLNIPPGEYFLNDDAGRFSNISIEISDDDSTRTTIFTSNGPSNTVNLGF